MRSNGGVVVGGADSKRRHGHMINPRGQNAQRLKPKSGGSKKRTKPCKGEG